MSLIDLGIERTFTQKALSFRSPVGIHAYKAEGSGQSNNINPGVWWSGSGLQASIEIEDVYYDPEHSQEAAIRFNGTMGGASIQASEYFNRQDLFYGALTDWELIIEATYKARLCAIFTPNPYHHKNHDGSMWGPQPQGAEDLTDCQGYESAQLGWVYWGDGVLKLTARGYRDEYYRDGHIGDPSAYVPTEYWNFTHEAQDIGENPGVAFLGPATVLATGAYAHYPPPIQAWPANVKRRPAGIVLSVISFNEAPRIPVSYEEIKNELNQRIGRIRTAPGFINAGTGDHIIGANWEPEGASVQFDHLEPPRTVGMTASAVDGGGFSYPVNYLDCSPLNGPSLSANMDQDVEFNYPNADTYSDTPGVPIDLKSPGSWSGTGDSYKCRGQFSLNTGFYFDVTQFGGKNFAKNTISDDGLVKLGFCYVGSSLTSKNLSKYAWRFPIEIPGPNAIYNAVTVEPKAAFSLHTFTTGLETWVGIGNTELTHSSGVMRLSGGNPKQAAVVQWGADKRVHSFRFLRIRHRSQHANVACKLTITELTDKTWTHSIDADGEVRDWKSGTDWKYSIIDLCCPDEMNGTVLDLSRTQHHYSGGVETHTQGDWGWGLEPMRDGEPGNFTWTPHTVKLEFDTTGWVDIDSIEAISLDNGLVVVNETITDDERFRITDREGLYQDYRQWESRGLLLVREGRVVEDLPVGFVTETDDKKEGSELSIADMFDRSFSGSDGLTLCYYNEKPGPLGHEMPGHCLIPGVYKYIGSNNLYIPARKVVDRVVLHCAASLTLHSRRMFASGVYGLVCDDTAGAQAKSGLYVRLTPENAPTTVIDQDTTSVRGCFDMPTNALKYINNATDYWVFGESSASNVGDLNKLIHGVHHRAALDVEHEVATGDGISSVKSVTGQVYLAYGQGGDVKLKRYTTAKNAWSNPAVLFEGSEPSIALIEKSKGRELEIYYSNSGIKRRISNDNGDNWGDAVSIVSGTKPFILVDKRLGIRHRYLFYLDGSAIKLIQSFDNGGTWSNAVTVVASAADDYMSAEVLDDKDRTIVLAYRKTSGDVDSVKSTDGGYTWS